MSLPQNTTAIFELAFSLTRQKKNNQNKIRREYDLVQEIKIPTVNTGKQTPSLHL